jgi:hypothetical protein
MNILKPALTSLSVTALIIMMLTSYAYASDDDNDDQKSRSWKISGTAVTGPNDRCGEAEWILPPPFPPNTHFTLSASMNSDPGAEDGIELSPSHCDPDLILVTHSNKMLNMLGGMPDAHPRMKNIPLHQVPVKATLEGVRMFLPPENQSNGNPFPPTRSLPNDPITVGQWMKGRGSMTVHCNADGTAKINVKFKNLIKNGVYSLVATWLTTLPDSDEVTFAPLPFGGIPNEVIADSKGNAAIKRKLNHCPMDDSPDGSSIMFVDLGYHMDGSTKGVLPQTANVLEKTLFPDGELVESFMPPGILTIPHIGFPLRAVER